MNAKTSQTLSPRCGSLKIGPIFNSRVADDEVLRLARIVDGDTALWPEDIATRELLVELAQAHRVDGLLDALARDGHIDVSTSLAASLAGSALRAEHGQSQRDARFWAILDVFDQADVHVELMALKGWYTSLTCYAQRSDRRYNDLDFWVSPLSRMTVGGVAELLAPANHKSARAYDRLLDLDLLHNAAIGFRGGLVELHKNPYGLKVDSPGLASIWVDHARTMTVDGRDVVVPSLELALATACVNYTRDCFPSLYQLVDIRRMSQRDDLVWPEFWALCKQQGLEHFAHGALYLTASVFESMQSPQVRPPSGWRAWWFRQSHVLRLEQPLAARVPATLLAPGGVGATVGAARHWIMPPDEYWEIVGPRFGLDAGGSYSERLRQLYRRRFDHALRR